MNMVNVRKAIICMAAAATALATASCQKDDTLAYNNMTMGNIVEGKIVSDQGNTFNIVRQTCGGSLEGEKRVMILCDVLNETNGTDNEYDVCLTSFASVLEKQPVALENAGEGEIAVQNPVLIDQLWFSGGYVNMMVRSHVKPGSDSKHLVNLVYSKNDKGEYVFNFRHNAYEEVWSKENASQLVISGGSYISFPIADIIKENEAKIILNWKWYKTTEFEFDFSTEEDYEFRYDWKRSGFIQKF